MSDFTFSENGNIIKPYKKKSGENVNREKIYLSTIAPDAVPVAREFGFGVEIAEFCTAWNMDKRFSVVDAALQTMLDGIDRSTLHGPFNELFPCAIDMKARSLASYRYRQATDLAIRYGSSRVILHGGYNPWIYYPDWYVKQSIVFWKDFLKKDPGVKIVLENVLEEKPGMLLDIVQGVDDPRLRLCLDVGHVNAYSKVSVLDWLEAWAPWLDHFHIHNNDGSRDEHNALNMGSIPMKALLLQAKELCPDATVTLELMQCRDSVQWLAENELI